MIIKFLINKLDIIKIDTNGFDFEVIEGFKKWIKHHRPVIQFELSRYWLKMEFTLKQSVNFFKDLKYDLYIMKNSGLKDLNIPISNSRFVTTNIMELPKEINTNILKLRD
tara:strand:+ start:4716 stop:5045 length:330 start_codon:yes stop_codon:yes gene_type:complete